MSLVISQNDISMIRGDTASICVKMKTTAGALIPFVPGDGVYFTVKRSTADVDKVLQKHIVEFIDGLVYINIGHDDTALLATGDYVYDVQINRVEDGSVTTIIPPSIFSLKREVTYE